MYLLKRKYFVYYPLPKKQGKIMPGIKSGSTIIHVLDLISF